MSILLSSRFPMWMAWGPELTFFCNAAYRRDTLGRKYPWALGRPASEVWAEIWDDIGPRIETVLATGRGDLGRGAAAVPGALRLPGGDATTPSPTARCATTTARVGRHAVRGQRGHRAGHRRAADGDAARSRAPIPAWCAPSRRCWPSPAAQLEPQPARPAVHADLPVRRRRQRPAGRGDRHRRPGIRPRPHDAGRRRRRRCGRWRRWRAASRSLVDARRRRVRGLPTGDWPEPPDAGAGGAAAAAGRRAVRVPGRRAEPLPRAGRRLPRLRRAGRRARRGRHRQRPQLPGPAAAGRGAGRAGPGQDHVLLQHQPRVPHPADPDHGAGGGAARRGSADADDGGPRGAGRHPPQRAAAGQAGQHPAGLLPHRGRPDAGPLRAGRPGRGHRRAGQRLPLGGRAGRAWPSRSTARRWPSRCTSTAACGRRSSSTCSATR